MTNISALAAIEVPRKRRRMRRKSAHGYDFRVQCIVFGNALGNSIVGAIQQADFDKNLNNLSDGAKQAYDNVLGRGYTPQQALAYAQDFQGIESPISRSAVGAPSITALTADQLGGPDLSGIADLGDVSFDIAPSTAAANRDVARMNAVQASNGGSDAWVQRATGEFLAQGGLGASVFADPRKAIAQQMIADQDYKGLARLSGDLFKSNDPIGYAASTEYTRIGFNGDDIVSLGAGFLPGTGSVMSAYSLATGRDIVSGEPVNRWLSALGVVAGMVPGGRGAVSGTGRGIFEATASASSRWDADLARIVQDGHAIQRHGGSVTDSQLIERATTGIAPDGSSVVRRGETVIPSTSSAFYSDDLLAQADALVRDNYLERAIALSPPGAQRVVLGGIDMGAPVGRGFDSVSSSVGMAGPLQFHPSLSNINAVYDFDALAGVWRTTTIYPGR